MENQKLKVLIVEDEPGIRQSYEVLLGDDHTLTFANNCFLAHKKYRHGEFDVVILDINLPDGSGLDILKAIRRKKPEQLIIMSSANQDAQSIVDAIQLGANDYITKPVEKKVLFRAIDRVLQNRKLQWENTLLREKIQQQAQRVAKGIVGVSIAMRHICETAAKLKGTQTPVLLIGESGVGKEVIAQAIHKQEDDPLRPFIAVNCAAIPENLLESELFGHEKGAFTGAAQARKGKFIQANGGDIFLDEIACMSPVLQAKLLRVLQDKMVEPIGSSKKIKSNFRVISATNQDIQAAIQKGKFRQDLYYRLQGIEIYIPPLRARTEDIPLLVEHITKDLQPQFGVRHFTQRAVSALTQYDWPGNVRELKNVIENILILNPQEVLDEKVLPPHIKLAPAASSSPAGRKAASTNGHTAMFAHLRDNLKNFEREVIEAALNRYRGNKSRAAKELGISRSILYRKMKLLGMEEGEETN